MLSKPEAERFWSHVQKTETCWLWLGWNNGNGYGKFNIRRDGKWKAILAHRYSYELAYGQIKSGLELDHICRNPQCVNPRHLEAVSHTINVLRGASPATANAHKKQCLRGHSLSGKNLYIVAKTGSRRCRECERERQRNVKRVR